MLQEDAALPELYAVDTTFLISANSALFPTNRNGLRDKDSDKAFQALLTYLCNGKRFSYVRPGTDAITKFPILKLVEETGAKAKTLQLTPQGTQENYLKVTEDFVEFLTKGFTFDVAKWVKFQFDDDDLEQIFFDGGEKKQIDRMLEARIYLKRSSAYREILDKWRQTGIEDLSFPSKHQLVATSEFDSKAEYALTYGFFGFAKGLFYPLQLDDELRNCVHWLREYPLKRAAQRAAASSESVTRGLTDPLSAGLIFDWRKILLALSQQSENLADFRAQLPGFVEVLKRETNVEELVGILCSGRGEPDLQKAEQRRRKAAEDFVFRALMKTSWHPKLVDIKGYQLRAKAIATATAIAVGVVYGLIPGIIGAGVVLTGVNHLNLMVESRWYARAQLRATKRFSREKLWSCFDGSAIVPTIDGFIR